MSEAFERAYGDVDAALRAAGTPERAASEKAYLKSALRFYGAGLPVVRRVAATFGRPGAVASEALREVVDAAWASGIHEHRALAVVLLERHERVLNAADLDWLLGLVRRSHTWAYVDGLGVHTIGPIIERSPGATTLLRTWAGDPDFWVRRTALLAPLGALRRGGGDFALWEAIAVPMLGEKEFFIRKAIGWVLRDTARRRPADVRGFVERHGGAMASLSRREAERGLLREGSASLSPSRR